MLMTLNEFKDMLYAGNKLPDEVTVHGNLTLKNRMPKRSSDCFPKKFYLRGYFYACDCINLISLPDVMEVDGFIIAL